MSKEKENEAAPRPWLWYENQDGQLIIADANGNEVGQVFVDDEVAQRIVEAVNGDAEAHLEAAKLRDLVRRLLPWAAERLATVNERALLAEAREALAEGAE